MPHLIPDAQPDLILSEEVCLSQGYSLAERCRQTISPDAQRRIDLTISCRDCEDIPKVADAGTIFDLGGQAVQKIHNGLLVLAGGYHGAWMVDVISRLRGHHEPQEEKAFDSVLNALGEAGLMIELGSFWSYYSLWFLERFPEAQTILVEPDPNNLEIGQLNYQLNGRQGTFYQASVGDISTDPQPFQCESDGQTRPIPQVCVDDLVGELKLPKIDILFADVQGAETAMLDGAEKTITQGKVRFVFISTHHSQISGDPLTHQKCLRKLIALGGRIVVDHTVEESFSGDGLIVASFCDSAPKEIVLSHCRHRDSFFGSSEDKIADVMTSVTQLQEVLIQKDRQLLKLKKLVPPKKKEPDPLTIQLAVARKALVAQAEARTTHFLFPRNIRAWRRFLEQRKLSKMASDRVRSLRSQALTEWVIGNFGIFELHRGDEVITPEIRVQLEWDIPAIHRVMRLVKAHTGHSLKSATLLDIGANIGMVGLQIVFAESMKRCIAIEPHPDNFALLHSNVQSNGLAEKFYLGWCALGALNGKCEMEEAPENRGDHRIRMGSSSSPVEDERYAESQRQTIKVPMRRLDDFLENCPGDFLSKIGLCWIDVQGFEAYVLEGGLGYFQKHGWPSVLEFWPYGLRRASIDCAKFTALVSVIWKKFLVLEQPDDLAWRSFDTLQSLWDELGTEGAFVNILCVR